MKVYKDCDLVAGNILRGMIMNWLEKAGVKHLISDGPPIGEWYRDGATMYKPIDKEITDYMRETIIAGARGGGDQDAQSQARA